VADRVASLAADLPAWRQDEHELLRWCRLVTSAGGCCGPEDLRLPEVSGDLCGDECGETGAITPARPHSPAHTEADARPYVVLHPGAASGSRRWPVDRWVAVAHELSRQADVRLTGSDDERALCEAVATLAELPATSVTAGSLDLPSLVDLVAQAALLVCGDTGVAHVATATATPSVLLFGPVSPRQWGPAIDHEVHHVIWHGDGTGDPHGDAPDPALLRITPDEVLAAADALLPTRDPARTFDF
jgi:ADP-heptose:LPS heptosyltransferase